MKKIPDWVLVLSIIIIGLPLFFYKLGQSSLISWDEAWYASIAVNFLKHGDFLHSWFNGSPFFDHPPLGFWLMAISFKIFGTSEFWARFPSALFGVLTLVFTFLLGKKIGGKLVGLLSSTAVLSATWFVERARSGDLDIFLTFLFVASFYFAFLSLEKKKFIYYLSVSIAFLLMTKTLIPFAVFPALIYLFWNNRIYKFKDFIIPVIIAILPFGIWFLSNSLLYPDFVARYLFIGTRGVTTHANILSNLILIKGYLRVGIGVWFWPAILSFIVGIFLGKKSFRAFLFFFVTFLIPFALSDKGQIWHFVPLYPIMILNLVGVAWVALCKIFEMRSVAFLLLIIPVLYYSYKQTMQNWYSFIDIPTYVSDEAILSKEAANYGETFYIDGDFLPAAAYYSGRNVSTIPGTLNSLFVRNEKFALITKQSRLDESKISPNEYKILKTDRDKILLLHVSPY